MQKRYLLHVLTAVVLTALIAFLALYGLGQAPLERWDEQTNTAVVEHIVESGDYLSLKNGQVDFFEKPPMWYALTALVVKTFGMSLTSLRIISASSFILLSFLLFNYLRKTYSLFAATVGVLALTATTQLFLYHPGGYFSSHTVRSADLDVLQILFIFGAVLAFGRYLDTKDGESGKPRFGILGSVLSAAATLTKGPLGLTPIILLGIYVALRRRANDTINVAKRLPFFAFVFLAITTPWYALMSMKYGQGFWKEHVGYHVAKRLLTPLEGHNGDTMHYLDMLLSGKLAPSPAYLLPIIATIQPATAIKALTQPKRFVEWASCIFVPGYMLLITLMRTKLAWYLLPVYPFMALLLGIWVHNTRTSPNLSKLAKVLVLSIVIAPMVAYTIINILMVFGSSTG